MPTPEQARKELEKLKVSNWQEGLLDSLKRLPQKLRDVGRPILGVDDEGEDIPYDEQDRLRAKTLPLAREMSCKQRLQLFETLFPKLGEAVEAGWQLHSELPHSLSLWQESKSFRIRGEDSFLLSRRLQWVESLLAILGPYPNKDLVWIATWAAHLSYHSEPISVLLAAAMDSGTQTGDEVFEILCDSARGEHPIGTMGKHVVHSLLSASRTDGWEFIENMLIAAQREEGLRQSILESVDAARPEVFRRFLRLILDHNLVRFSATVRALDVWLGYMWDSVSTGVANAVIEKLLLYLEDNEARSAALKGKDAEQVYLALWSIAFDNALAVLKPAAAILKNPKPEFRFVAAKLLSQIQIPSVQKVLLVALEDESLHVPYTILQALEHGELDPAMLTSNTFERLEKLLARLPSKPTKLKAMVWPWTDYKIDRSAASSVMIRVLGNRPATRLIPHLEKFSAYERGEALELLAKMDKVDSDARDAFLRCMGDGTRSVREKALAGLQKYALSEKEAPTVEGLLTRSAGDLRKGILQLLLKQSDSAALASADRLVSAGSAPQRLAGLEICRQLADAQRCVPEARDRAGTYRKAHPKLSEAERQQIESIETARTQSLSLENALGLINHEERTWPAKPVDKKISLHSAAAVRLIQGLDELIHQHREKTVTLRYWYDEELVEEKLLGEIDYGFPSPRRTNTLEQDKARLPLLEIWHEWWMNRSKSLRDTDGFELLRALAWFDVGTKLEYSEDALKKFAKRSPSLIRAVFGNYPCPKLKYGSLVKALLEWMHRLYPVSGAQDFLLDAVETLFAQIPESELRYKPKEENFYSEDCGWRDYHSPLAYWPELLNANEHVAEAHWTPAHHVRRFQLMRWADEPFGRIDRALHSGKSVPRERAGLNVIFNAYHVGGATDADVFDQLLGFREAGEYGRISFDDLSFVTYRHQDAKDLEKSPSLRSLIEKCRERILEVELTRGDSPTPASKPAMALKSVDGAGRLFSILRALGKGHFKRGWSYDNENKETVLSHLVRICFPAPGETIAHFVQHAKKSELPASRLVELAVYAPQWAPHVEAMLNWPNLVDAIWWIHGHTKGADWNVESEIRDIWKADLSSRTTLSSEELLEGAVDVNWFMRIHTSLGKDRWALLDEAAKYASTGSGHARARLFADAMLGHISKKELMTRIKDKRHQDAVRALGLLPLASGKSRDSDLLDRYQIMQEFIRTSRQFGSQRQASEKRSAQIGQENLARTAGYPDPIRLQWAMEARAIGDLADGPIQITIDGVTLSLGIDPWGEVEWKISKEGKSLNDIPTKLKKDKRVAELRGRKTELKRQASRIRQALEFFMCKGESVTGRELQELMKHPILAPMLSGLVLVGEGIKGYPIHGGKALQDHSANMEGIKPDEKIRIAHPVHLLPASEWHAWQKDCLAREFIQPFKQVFRELYVPTKTEKDEATQSRRYAGHQVHPRKAMALLGTRGWISHPEEGVRKTYHDAGITAWLEFNETFSTAAEIEGLTLEAVYFTQRNGEHKRMKLLDLPPALFSETMRDLDLMVSVAHRGNVDPEASASTLEMRAALVKETCSLLKLTRVRIKENTVLIHGDLAEYTVHLGSGIARKMPGVTLFIVAVQAQHRGRLFLPFADNDPRTAEVLSKVLLLARDKEIKDPGIISQIQSG